MGFRINTNIAAMNAHTSATMNNRNLDNSLAKLSSGLRINTAADDASGLSIANSLRAQASSLGQAVANGNDAIGLIQTADGALSEYSNILNTIKTKTVQAASDTQNTSSRLAIQKDIDALMEELDIIATTTSFNGQKLLSGSFTNKEFQMGANANESVSVNIASATTNSIGATSRSELTLANSQGGDVALKVTSATTGSEIQLKTINVAFDNTTENSMGAVADELNKYSGETGITAKAIVESSAASSISAGTTGSDFAINGVNIGAVTVSDNDSTNALLTAINGKTNQTGVTATVSTDGKLNLASDGRSISVEGNIAAVAGASADQLSTIGKLEIVQVGSSTIQIEADGVAALSSTSNVALGADMLTQEASTLAVGSIIAAGTKMAQGSTIGGDTKMLTSSPATGIASNALIVSGSTIAAGSTLEQGTQVGGSFTVGSTTAGGSNTNLNNDMTLTAGSILKTNSVLGKGTVVEQNFDGFKVGDVLTNDYTLTSALVLTADMTLKDNANASSTVAMSSTINTGSVLGADFIVGLELTDLSGGVDDLDAAGGNLAGVITSGNNAYVHSNTTIAWATDGADGDTLAIGIDSLLTDGTKLSIATGANYTGPDLVTTNGLLKSGTLAADVAAFGLAAAVDGSVQIELEGDQVLNKALTVTANGADNGTGVDDIINAGSILTEFDLSAATTVTAGTIHEVTGSTGMTVSTDMTALESSKISAGSTLKAGSSLGSDAYVYGTGANEIITTTTEMSLNTGSILAQRGAGNSELASGSTIGGNLTTAVDETTAADMIVKAGSTLADESKLAAGTVLQQDLVLEATTGGTGTTFSAGTKLATDMFLDGAQSINKDLIAKEGSIIADASILSRNAASSGAVDITDADLSNLSSISVLTLDDAMKAIDTVSAAIGHLDSIRSDLGSAQNQVVSTINNISVTQVNVKAAESNIRDVDFAAESANFSKFNILAQSGSYAMSQANAVQQNVMRLLQ